MAPKALTRDEKAENLVLNYSMIMMALFEGTFETLASKMSEAVVAGATAMSEALADGTGPEKGAVKPPPNVGPEVTEGVEQMFSKMRSEVRDRMSAGDETFEKFLKDPRFAKGIKIAEGYEFGLPKLTEPLSDGDIAAYLTLVGKQDRKLGKMLHELGEWQSTMPRLSKDERL